MIFQLHQDNHISNLWKVTVFHLATKVTSIPKFNITVPILSWIFTLAKYSFMEELIQKSGHMAIITKNMEQLNTEMPSNFHMCTGWQNLPRCQPKGINTIFPVKDVHLKLGMIQRTGKRLYKCYKLPNLSYLKQI